LGAPGQTTVTISQNGSATAATILTANARQIDALMPRTVKAGPASVMVTAAGPPSKPFPIEIAASNPGIFSRSGEGWGRGVIDKIDAAGARRANSIDDPARLGQTIVLAATGMGDAKEIGVVIGNRLTKGSSVRRTDTPGMEEITVRIPADAPAGCHVPVYL